MKARQPFIILTAMLLVFLTGTVWSGNNTGIGGTGHQRTDSITGGIGGTGKRPTGGIGGTGIIGIVSGGDDSGIGGTGVIARSNGGLIRVGGLEVSLTDHTSIDALQPGVPARLAAGQLVMIESFDNGKRVRASRIHIVHAVTGPIAQISVARDRIRVLGQTIRLHSGTRIDDDKGRRLSVRQLRTGQTVAVSGLRNSKGIIEATRILVMERGVPTASVIGVVNRVDQAGIHIQGLTLEPGARTVKAGQRIHAHGRIVAGRFQVADLSVIPNVPFGGRFKRVILEGYASQMPGMDRRIRVSSHPVAIPPGTRITGGRLRADSLVRVYGYPEHDRLVARRIEIERPWPLHDRHTMPERAHGMRGGHERPEMERHDNDRPEMEKPEMEKPEMEKPEMERPEMEKPEMEKPEY